MSGNISHKYIEAAQSAYGNEKNRKIIGGM